MSALPMKWLSLQMVLESDGLERYVQYPAQQRGSWEKFAEVTQCRTVNWNLTRMQTRVVSANSVHLSYMIMNDQRRSMVTTMDEDEAYVQSMR